MSHEVIELEDGRLMTPEGEDEERVNDFRPHGIQVFMDAVELEIHYGIATRLSRVTKVAQSD